MAKIAQPIVSLPGGVEEGFQIGFGNQTYTCIGFKGLQTRSGGVLNLIIWSAKCASCGGAGEMTSTIDNVKPSKNCAPCRARNRR